MSGGVRQRGLGLIEVLVALVIVSFGVLGMAGLQLTGMKHSSGGFNRTKALMFAENAATRMRIGSPDTLPAPLPAAWHDFDSGDRDDGYCASRPDPYCQTSADGAAERCNLVELATFDVWSVTCGDWGEDAGGGGVREELPEGRLEVSCGATPCPADATYTITVEWNEGSARSAVAGAPVDPDAIDLKRVQMRLRP